MPRRKKFALFFVALAIVVTALVSMYAPPPRPYYIVTLVLLVLALLVGAYGPYQTWTRPIPVLRLTFSDDRDSLTLTPKFYNDHYFEERVQEVAQERYSGRLNLFYRDPLEPSVEEKRTYFKDWLHYEARLNHILRIWFNLHNDGNAGAQNVDVRVVFPDGYEVAETLPEPPERPRLLLSDAFAIEIELGLIIKELRQGRQTPQQLTSVDQGKREVRFRVAYVNPGTPVRLGPVYAIPHAEPHEADVVYRIVCQGQAEQGALEFSGAVRLVSQPIIDPPLDELLMRYRERHPDENDEMGKEREGDEQEGDQR